MRGSTLRHVIVLQQRSTSVDAYGQQLTTWANFLTVWGHIEALTARELLAAQAIQAETTHRITVRWRVEFANPAVVSALRATYAGRNFNIGGSLNVDERNRVLQLLCTEGLNDG